jgi:hypothetical protein
MKKGRSKKKVKTMMMMMMMEGMRRRKRSSCRLSFVLNIFLWVGFFLKCYPILLLIFSFDNIAASVEELETIDRKTF